MWNRLTLILLGIIKTMTFWDDKVFVLKFSSNKFLISSKFYHSFSMVNIDPSKLCTLFFTYGDD